MSPLATTIAEWLKQHVGVYLTDAQIDVLGDVVREKSEITTLYACIRSALLALDLYAGGSDGWRVQYRDVIARAEGAYDPRLIAEG